MSLSTASFKFGSFEWVCERASLVVCPMLGESGIEPTCYARNVQLGSQIIFQPGESQPRDSTSFLGMANMV